jgi:16S rRNA (adenine1518-N6/adenine1519-N6)-dimethyltransferase
MTSYFDKLPSIATIVKQYELQPKKSLGQNFIFDSNLLRKIASAAGDLTDATVLEVGPGPGGLTRAILDLGAKRVIAIEQDARCVAALSSLVEAAAGRLEVTPGDALTFEIDKLLPLGDVKIIANLPYNIATPLLIKWLEKIDCFSSLTLMFQKEVASRIISPPRTKAYGRLSVMSQFACTVEHNFDIAPQAFVPPPKVTSSVITLTRKKERIAGVTFAALEKLCKVTFGQRRKSISTSLKQCVSNPLELLSLTSIAPKMRPEELSLEQFCELVIVLVKNSQL